MSGGASEGKKVRGKAAAPSRGVASQVAGLPPPTERLHDAEARHRDYLDSERVRLFEETVQLQRRLAVCATTIAGQGATLADREVRLEAANYANTVATLLLAFGACLISSGSYFPDPWPLAIMMLGWGFFLGGLATQNLTVRLARTRKQ